MMSPSSPTKDGHKGIGTYYRHNSHPQPHCHENKQQQQQHDSPPTTTTSSSSSSSAGLSAEAWRRRYVQLKRRQFFFGTLLVISWFLMLAFQSRSIFIVVNHAINAEEAVAPCVEQHDGDDPHAAASSSLRRSSTSESAELTKNISQLTTQEEEGVQRALDLANYGPPNAAPPGPPEAGQEAQGAPEAGQEAQGAPEAGQEAQGAPEAPAQEEGAPEAPPQEEGAPEAPPQEPEGQAVAEHDPPAELEKPQVELSEPHREKPKSDDEADGGPDLKEKASMVADQYRDWKCQGFQQTGWCNKPWELPKELQECDAKISKFKTGYCVYTTPDGKEEKLMELTCDMTFRKKLRCKHALEFESYKHLARTFVQEPPMTLSASYSSSQEPKRGIVMTIHDRVTVSAYAAIHLLRNHHGCTLPIELWYRPDEIYSNNTLLGMFMAFPNVTARTIDNPDIKSYMVKPYSIFYSQFDQVLSLDADNFALLNPAFLFDAPELHKTGTLFFPDYWHPGNSFFELDENSVLWKLLGIDFPENEFELETGQLLLDKTHPNAKAALDVLMYLTNTFDTGFLGWSKLVWGDKDLFRLAYHMVQKEISIVDKPPGALGYHIKEPTRPLKNTGRTCPQSMLQYAPTSLGGQPLFAHRNTFKLNALPAHLQYSWEGYYEFTGNDPSSQYVIAQLPSPQPHVYNGEICWAPRKINLKKYFKEVRITENSPIAKVEKIILDLAHEVLPYLPPTLPPTPAPTMAPTTKPTIVAVAENTTTSDNVTTTEEVAAEEGAAKEVAATA